MYCAGPGILNPLVI